jgi:hypothetical protein
VVLNALLRGHIAELLGVDAKTVSDYIEDSKPGGKHAGDPVPEPAGYLDSRAPGGWVTPEQRRPGLRPFWNLESRGEWLAWRERHPPRMRKAG